MSLKKVSSFRLSEDALSRLKAEQARITPEYGQFRNSHRYSLSNILDKLIYTKLPAAPAVEVKPPRGKAAKTKE